MSATLGCFARVDFDDLWVLEAGQGQRAVGTIWRLGASHGGAKLVGVAQPRHGGGD